MKLVNDDIKVESKGNNSNLRKAVSKINEDYNTYYILIDNVVANPDVMIGCYVLIAMFHYVKVQKYSFNFEVVM